MRMRNLLLFGWHTLASRVSGRRVPLNVMLAVTNRCTASCSYCAIPQRRGREMTTAEICDIIDEIASLGCQRLGLWGGEPLVREDIGEIIGHARSRGLFVTLDSNGHLVPERLDAVRQLDHLVLSLDGPKEMHDANRGEGSFEKVMAAVDAAAGLVPVWTITVLTKRNLAGIDWVLETAERRGMRATFQLPHHNAAMGRNHAELLAGAGEYRKAIEHIIARARRGAPVASTRRYLEHLLRWEDYGLPTAAAENGGPACRAGDLYCNIDADGKLYPCSLAVGGDGAPSVLAGGFAKAFAELRTRQDCKSCIASCYTEYNYLFALDGRTIAGWLGAMAATRGRT